MTPAEIYQSFLALITAGAISGNNPLGVADLLGTLGVTTLPITGGTAGETTDSAWMTGTTSYRGTSWSFTLTGRDGGNAAQPSYVALSLQLAAIAQATAWTFAQAFPGAQLPKTRLAKSTLTPPPPGGGLVLRPSVIAPLVLQTPSLAAANNPSGASPPPILAGWLDLTGSSLDRYVAYLGASRLRLSGPLNLSDPTKPVLLLDAPAPGASTDFGSHVSLDEVGVRLWSAYPDPCPLPDEGAPTSSAMLYVKFSADTLPPTRVTMTAPLLFGDYVWPIYVAFGENPLTLSTGAQMLASLLAGSRPADYSLPTGIAALNLFGVSELEFGLYPPDGDDIGVAYSAVTIVSVEPWDPPIPFVLINQVGVRWMFDWTGEKTLMTASVWGTMTFGAKKATSVGSMTPYARRSPTWRTDGVMPDESHVVLTVRLDIPDMAFLAYTEAPITLPIADAFAAYFGTPAPDVPALIISEINFQASLPRKTYEAGLTVQGKWPVTCGTVIFNLDEIEFRVVVSQSAVNGTILGTVSIAVPDETPVQLMLQAEYPGDGHWVFVGQLVGGPINLPKFVTAFLGFPYPDWMNSDTFVLELTQFLVSYSTATGNPYKVSAGLAAKLKDTVLGLPVAMTASAMIERRASPTSAGTMVTVGSLSGTFTVARLAITAGVSFRENEKTYVFSVAYRDLTLSGATAWIGEAAARHQILTLRLSGETLGGVVRFLVGLANPNANFRLEPPWDFLDTIELGRFALVIDPTLEQVTLTYDVDLNLVFARLDTVGLRYDRSSGTPQVNFVLTGQVLGTQYTPDTPLTWDVVNEAPPALPGKGQSLFDLRYLGLGQHVSLKGMTTYTSIADVIDAMRADMAPFEDLRKVPINPAKMGFDPASQWLFGIDCTIMDTVTLKLVLHDPDLYGVLLSLAGPEAGALAGLSFELMYKKVTADVGVFHVRLQIPDAFRQLQFGAISVTLGIITVDIYTNGHFLVDLGFPHDRDFSVSFGVEAGIFNGRGGIYFGLRDGATSDRVPRITNGTFSPVIELGVGLEVGVGRTFEKGPLSAGLYVDLVVIFEGVLAWFHPSDAGSSTALYYWCRGTAGIVGKLYGSVDFKIISVSVSVEAHAFATLTLAAHEATLVELDVGVSVEASVHFLFFSVSFSFGLQLQASFTIGESSPTPWQIAPGQSGRQQAVRLAQSFAPPRRRPPHVAAVTRHAYRLRRFAHPASRVLDHGQAAIVAVAPPAALAKLGGRSNGIVAGVEPAASAYHLVFDKDAAVFPGAAVHTGTIQLIPAFTVADVPVDWTGVGPAPPNPNPAYRIAMMLMADTAATAASAADALPTTFGQIAEGLLRWSLYALGVTSPTAIVTLGALEELNDQLALPEAATQGFTWTNLDGFFSHNLHLTLSAPPAGDPSMIDGVVFPMIPPLQWTSTTLPASQTPRQFWTYQPVDTTYETDVLGYFAKLDARAPGSRPDLTRRLDLAADDDTESMATFVFRDYAWLVARAMVQSAISLLSAYPHIVVATDSLAQIAAGFPTTQVIYVKLPDDTLETIAVVFGMSSMELVALNPGIAATLAATAAGQSLAITLGVTPESIAAANPSWPLVAGKSVTLGDLIVSVQAGDTLSNIAIRYGVGLGAWLSTPALLTQSGLTRAGATLALSTFSYANPLALPVATVAAVFWVRLSLYHLETTVPLAEWYAEAIAALNSGLIPASGPLPATLQVPGAYDPDANGAPVAAITWRTLPGDTLSSVAGAVAATQVGDLDADYTAWLNAVIAANTPAPASGIALPASAILIVRPDDTLAAVQQRLLLDPTIPAQVTIFQSLIKSADILMQLAQVLAPAATGTIPAGQTLIGLAQAYGLALEDLGRRIQEDVGVLAVLATRSLTVPSVPALGLDPLTTALRDPAIEAGVSGQVARFMLYGVRMPAPVLTGSVYRATGPMTGLYDLVGQQVTGPVADVNGPEPAFSLTMSLGQTCDWLSLATSVVTQPDDTLTAFSIRHPNAASLNPGLAGSGAPLPEGMIVLTDSVDSILLSLTQAQLSANYPATGLVPALKGAIQPLPLYRDMQVRHPVTQVIAWRTTVAPTLPIEAQAGAVPSLWLLSGDLMSLAAAGSSASAFHLMQVSPQAGPTAVPTELTAYAWGTLIDVDIRSVPGSPETMEVLGADTADRQRLARLLTYLGVLPGAPAPPVGETANLILAWQLPASSGSPPALTSTALTPAGTFLVKVNLSTDTHRGAQVRSQLAEAANPTSGPYFASIADSAAFLILLWEGSVVGGGGYWLQTAGGATPIPQSIFDQDGRATLSLLIQLKSQSTTQASPPWPVRNLLSFNNCAVVGDGVDPGSLAVFAQASDPLETERAATVPQGQVGFTLDLTNPGTAAPSDGQAALRQLYSLIGYQLTETTAFVASKEGQPIGPAVKVGPGDLQDDTTWNLMRVVPINRFAKSNPLLDLPTYPPPALSPYAGIQGASTPGHPVQAATRVQLWFHDVLGNASAEDPSDDAILVSAVDIPVGYTDPLVGVGGWPSATLSYQVVADKTTSGQALLSVETAFQALAYQPGPGEAGDAILDKADRDRGRYAGIYYQILQPDVTAALLTSLRQVSGQNPDVVAVPIAALQSFAIGTYAFLGTMAARARFLAASVTSLDAACTRYGVTDQTLGTANALIPLDSILAGPSFALPQTKMFRAGDTVASVCQTVTPPAVPATVLQDVDNIVLPLMAGVEITIPATTVTVPDPSPTVADLLKITKCSIDRLVAANKNTASLLTPGFIFECNGIRVGVDAEGPGAAATLSGVTSVFQGAGVPFDAAMIVSLNAEKPGLFRAGSALAVNSYVVAAGDTLAANGTGVGAAALAPLNTSTVTLFPDGTPLFMQVITTSIPVGSLLGAIAADAGVSPGAVLRHNGTAPLAASSMLAVSGLAAWPANAAATIVPYSIRNGDTLTLIAGRFGAVGSAETMTPLALATQNSAMPGTIAPRQSISVGGVTVQSVAGDSFQSVCNRFDPPCTLDALVAAIQDSAGVLAVGGLLVCPPGRLGPASSGQSGVIPAEAAARFGLSPAALLGANAGTPGLIVPAIILKASTTSISTQTTAAADSVTAILERFRVAGVRTSVDDLVLANPDIGFLISAASVVLPPANAVLTSPLAVSVGGVLQWRWPGAIFPVHAWLQLERSVTLVDAALAGTVADPSSVVRTQTAVAVARQGMTTDQPDGGAVTLVGFADQLQRAVPALRIATGKVLSETEQGQTGTDVWAVSFATDGITSVAVKPPLAVVAGAPGPQPRSFALRPLSAVLMARQGVVIDMLDPATGLLTGTKTADYQGIDLEVWARSFLTDVDHVLSATYVTGAYAVASAALQALIGAKKSLADAVSKGLGYVLESEGTAVASADDPNRASAIKALRQSLLVSLTKGYQTSAIIQYDTTTTSAFAGATARLSGVPVATLSDEDPALKAATLSNGKVSLQTGSSLVDVLVFVPDVEAHSSLAMQLTYKIVELEFNIADEIDGYQSSDWLTFVSPIGSGSPAALNLTLGTPLIPLVLRAYPQMPTLLDHSAISPTAPSSVAEAVLWTYEFVLRHQSTEQDQIELELTFNAAAATVRARDVVTTDLFGRLAQYTENAAAMLDILADLPNWRSVTDITRLANTLASYAACATGIAAAWTAHWPDEDAPRPKRDAAPRLSGPATESYGFVANLTTDPTATFYQSLSLVRTVQPAAVGWPTIVCTTPDGVPHRLVPSPAAAVGDVQVYLFPTEPALQVPAFVLLDFKFQFAALPIANYQNASAKVWVVRNAKLLGPTGATTRADFIYRTPIMSYLQPAVPFIDVTDRLPIGTWSYDPATCPLNAMFATIFGSDTTDRAIACGIRYGYELAPGAPPTIPPLETYLPVRQTPTFLFAPLTTVSDVCATLQSWTTANKPATIGGRWVFWIDLQSSIDPTLKRPILRLKHVTSVFS